MRIAIWAIISIALVKIAFAGAPLETSSDSAQPSGTITEPVIDVVEGTVTNSVTVAGSVVADPPVTVKSTGSGTVTKLLVATGDAVSPGTPILKVTRTDEPAQTDMTDGTTKPAKTTVSTVTATAAGVITISVLKDQEIAVADAVATINPGTLSAQGQLTPDQQYRLLSAPTEALVTLKGGPAPFTCSGVRIGPAASDSQSTEEAQTGQISCGIPTGVVAFAGLGADIQVTNGTATGPVVPTTAVQGSVQNGNVWVVVDNKEPEQRTVTLGLTDGLVVVVTEGLAVGDRVLEFTPVASDDPIDCSAVPEKPSETWYAECGG